MDFRGAGEAALELVPNSLCAPTFSLQPMHMWGTIHVSSYKTCVCSYTFTSKLIILYGRTCYALSGTGLGWAATTGTALG
eukprot:2597716-Rhodomonas_salina.4